ncbi:hypothetical protein DFP73DRAFT_601991 [Morchella snyderi]|nr:hypothetical protein DFP73DRAFT_601991 [Morchella snyderi]
MLLRHDLLAPTPRATSDSNWDAPSSPEEGPTPPFKRPSPTFKQNHPVEPNQNRLLEAESGVNHNEEVLPSLPKEHSDFEVCATPEETPYTRHSSPELGVPSGEILRATISNRDRLSSPESLDAQLQEDSTDGREQDSPEPRQNPPKAPARTKKAHHASKKRRLIFKEGTPTPREMPPRGRQPAAFKCTTIAEVRRILQLTGKDALYKALRTDLGDEMIRLGWVNKITSGEGLYNHLISYLIDHRAINALKPTFARKASEDSKKIAAALNFLIVDRTQKSSRTHSRIERALDNIEAPEDPAEGSPVDPWKELGIAPRPAITIHVLDPVKTRAPRSAVYRHYDWFGPASLPPSLGVLRDVSLQELTKAAIKRVPRPPPGAPERAIRAFYGAINNPPARGANAYPQNPEYCRIGDADELEAWLKTSEAKPLRICAVLHRSAALLRGASHRPQTPPPDGWDDLTPDDLIPAELEADKEIFQFADRVNKKGLRFPIPTQDRDFQVILAVIHERIERFQTLGRRLNRHYRRRFPNGITFDSCHYDRTRFWTVADRNHLFRANHGVGGDRHDQAEEDEEEEEEEEEEGEQEQEQEQEQEDDDDDDEEEEEEEEEEEDDDDDEEPVDKDDEDYVDDLA